MDIWTLLNIEMDIDAGVHREGHKQDKTDNILLEVQLVQLVFHEGHVCTCE